jgi:hypothetical protein
MLVVLPLGSKAMLVVLPLGSKAHILIIINQNGMIQLPEGSTTNSIYA